MSSTYLLVLLLGVVVLTTSSLADYPKRPPVERPPIEHKPPTPIGKPPGGVKPPPKHKPPPGHGPPTSVGKPPEEEEPLSGHKPPIGKPPKGHKPGHPPVENAEEDSHKMPPKMMPPKIKPPPKKKPPHKPPTPGYPNWVTLINKSRM